MSASRIPAARHPAPALPLVLVALGAVGALTELSYTWLFAYADGGPIERHRVITLVQLGGVALWSGLAVAGAVLTFRAAWTRRSPGAALAAAAAITNALVFVPFLVAIYLWPQTDASAGWRGDVVRIALWQGTGSGAILTAGLAWAAWEDRGVRLWSAAAVGALILSSPPPPLEEWMIRRFSDGAFGVVDGSFQVVDHTRLWSLPATFAFGSLAWGLVTGWIAHRLPRVPADAAPPRSPARALRLFAASLVAMPVVAIVAGLTIAVVQGEPASETGSLGLVIPIAVGLATAAVAAALLNLAITDVGAAASRRFIIAAVLVSWCVTVTAAQTLWSRRPQQPGARFTVFESPWMPGMVGAAVAVAALLAMAGALDATARALGQRPSRAQGAVVVLALVIGAATVPWLLGFGTRALPLDGLRIATLASAAVVNLAAWLALARAAWRCAASVPR